ncbi:autotransporter assembly complex protein TamA [Vibrio superstes]|uniref:Translocation and assembly module subunit TamA n=1 Tax=Vibrio superstes NBRC 103154 TaxID=1219062 RepID=A0A511QKT7_9VIBR|nr:autotransporter assembly complex family protein [Vibrio superstes]GEM77797.1 outer membrane protein assembly factor [Vibrio superstes NBRC 103154]
MVKLTQWIALLFATLPLSVYSATSSKITISGLPESLETNLTYHLDSLDSESMTRMGNVKLTKIVSEALNPFGYYHPAAELTRVDDKEIKLQVSLGPVTIIKEQDIVISGEAANDSELSKIVEQSKLNPGRVLHHQEYDNLKSKIQSFALSRGYLDGQFTEARLEVIPSSNEANIRIHFNSGDQYYFGDTRISNSQIEAERLIGLKDFERGDPFDVVKLSEYQVSLSETGWFSAIDVHPDYVATADLEVPVEVNVAPRSKNVVEVGGGYSSDVGIRGSLNWIQPWYNSRGHSFQSAVSVSVPEQSLLLGYKIPTRDILNDYYGIKFETKHVDYLNTLSLSSDLTFEKHWRLDNDWQSTVFVKFLYEDYQQATDEGLSKLLIPGISFSYIDKHQQQKQVQHKHIYSMEYSDSHLISDTQILRLTGESALSWKITDSQRLNFRVNMGANISDSLSDIPSSLRFFAGGDGSLRGYDYESISPVNEDGELKGAPYMLTTGVEYQHRIFDAFWIGGFVDVGDAFESRFEPKVGTGLSVIWDSGYVPIKLDVAHGLDADEGDQWKIYLSLGAQF